MKAIVRTAAARRSRLGNAQVASPTLAAQSAPLLARDRDSDGDGAYRLLGSLTPTSQLTSEVLAETRRTSKRLSRTRRRGPASGRVSQRLVSTDRSCTAPTTTSGWRASPARTPNRGHCPRGGRRPRLGRREQALVRGGTISATRGPGGLVIVFAPRLGRGWYWDSVGSSHVVRGGLAPSGLGVRGRRAYKYLQPGYFFTDAITREIQGGENPSADENAGADARRRSRAGFRRALVRHWERAQCRNRRGRRVAAPA